MIETVSVKVPKEFIGKWVLVSQYGTHGSYSVMEMKGGSVMCFDSEEHASAYKKQSQYGELLEVYQIEKDYPVCQVQFFICGRSTADLINDAKNKIS